jgi:D-3-phosphoglycerate dehydrogenase/(S)-sulfolactate dehydrogenase
MPIVQISPEAMLHKAAPYVDILREAGFEVLYPKNPLIARGVCSEQETIDELQGVSAVIATAERYTERVIAALPGLRVIARAGVGFDSVDIAAATAHGIAVTITPTANHEAVAELALALLFAVAKRVVSGDKQVRAGDWPRTPTQPVRGTTIGILGLGRIGRSMAVRCAALGMRVIATEQIPNHEFVRTHNIELVDFDELLARSDYLSLHCPLTDQSRGLFNRQTLARMKRGSVLINTARGKLVLEADLLEALQSGHLRAAAMDVFEQEPPSPDNPLFQLENVVVSPHIAGSDDLSIESMGIEAAQAIVTLYRGQWPEGAVVNDELKGTFRW